MHFYSRFASPCSSRAQQGIFGNGFRRNAQACMQRRALRSFFLCLFRSTSAMPTRSMPGRQKPCFSCCPVCRENAAPWSLRAGWSARRQFSRCSSRTPCCNSPFQSLHSSPPALLRTPASQRPVCSPWRSFYTEENQRAVYKACIHTGFCSTCGSMSSLLHNISCPL